MSHKPGLAKTKKSVAKRFRLTAKGKLKRNQQGKRHLLECKSANRKRRLRKSTLVADVDLKRLKACIPFTR